MVPICNKKQWIVLVTVPLQGHFTPMLQLGSLLHSKGFSIMVAHPQCDSSSPPHHPDFTFLPLLYALSSHGMVFGDMLDILDTMNKDCREPLVSFLSKMMKDEDLHGQVLCIVYDWLMNFGDAVATQLKLPSIVLRTSSAASTQSYQAILQLQAEDSLPLSGCQLHDPVPGLHALRFQDLPFPVSPLIPEILLQHFSSLTSTGSSVAVICNTTEDLEHAVLKQYNQDSKIPIFPLGPLHKMTKPSSTSFLEEDAKCIKWLDKQAPDSVIYISLGSSSTINKQELEETAAGLANSGQPFLWVIRPSSVHGSNWIEDIPQDLKGLVGKRGQIVKWAPQRKVLAHPAVGGFFSHCGWNSTLESICEAVPMICRPCFADQSVNTRYITHVWGVGLELEEEIDRDSVERTIRRLMVGNEGKEIKQKVVDLKEKIEACIQDDGSSYKSLNDLTNFIFSEYDKVSRV